MSNQNGRDDMDKRKDADAHEDAAERADTSTGAAEQPADEGDESPRGSKERAKGGRKANFLLTMVRRRQFKYGTYSTILVVAVIVIAMLINVGVASLDEMFNLKLDVTRNRLYSLSATTKSILEALDSDIEIYPLYPSQSENQMVLETLANYSTLSQHIKVEVVDPVRNPGFTREFQSDGTSISNGSIIVTNAEHSKYRVISSYDVVSYNYDSSSQSTYEDSFLGENKITNAIVYVTSASSPRVFFLEGHQEIALTSYSYVRGYLEGENFEVSNVSGMGLSELKAGDTLVVASPQRDLSDEERETLKAFLENNGRLLYMVDAPNPELPNFMSLLSLYGISVNSDVVVETDQNMYFQVPTYIAPNLGSHAITSALSTNKLRALMPNVCSLTLPERTSSTVTVTPLLTTSSGAYGKVDMGATTIEKEPGDTSGPFVVGVALEDKHSQDEYDLTRIVVIGSSQFVTNSSLYSFSGNLDLFLNSVKWMQDKMQTVSIVGKSLLGDRLNLTSATQQNWLVILAVVLLPLLVVLMGVVIWVRRRHL